MAAAKMRSLGWALTQHDLVFINRGYLDTGTVMHRRSSREQEARDVGAGTYKPEMGQQTTRSQVRGLEQTLGRNQPCRHPDLGSGLQTVRSTCLLLRLLSPRHLVMAALAN